MAPTRNSPLRLVVEGTDDKHTIIHLMEHHGVNWNAPGAVPFVDQSEGVESLLGATCQEKDHLKSRLHAWLAWQEVPGNPFGTALLARTFRHDSEAALRFVDWFRRLFG